MNRDLGLKSFKLGIGNSQLEQKQIKNPKKENGWNLPVSSKGTDASSFFDAWFNAFNKIKEDFLVNILTKIPLISYVLSLKSWLKSVYCRNFPASQDSLIIWFK